MPAYLTLPALTQPPRASLPATADQPAEPQSEDQRPAQPREARLSDCEMDFVREESPDLLLGISEQGRLAYANPAACRRLGRSREELLRTTLFDIAPGFSPERWGAVWQLIRSEGRLTFDSHLVGADGSALFVEMDVRHVVFSSGEYLLAWAHDRTRHRELEATLLRTQDELFARVSDVSAELARVNTELRSEINERKEVTSTLRAWEEKYRMIADSVTDVVWTCDLAGQLTYVSPSVRRVLGYSPHDLISTPVKDLLSPAVRGVARRRLRAFRNEVEAPMQVLELEILHRLGHPVVCESTLLFLRNNAGERVGVIGTTRDVTERKRIEEALIRSERLAAVGTLVAGIAHEFNNLNAVILGSAELALRDPLLGASARKRIEAIQDAALRGGAIAGNLLSVGARQAPQLRLGSLQRATEAAVALVKSDVAREGVTLVQRIGPTPPTFLAESQITQVILNILMNARHALLEQRVKRIEVETGVEGSCAYAKVTDTGCGIRRTHLAQLFTPFFTTKGEHAAEHSPQARVKGTGLGLSVSHTIVTNHGGALTVETQEGVGSTFKICLPLPERESEPIPSAGPPR